MHIENLMTGTVHEGEIRKFRASFTETGYVEFRTPVCEKNVHYGRTQRMAALAITDKPVTCARCLARKAPAKVEGFHLTVSINGYRETFRNVRTATSMLVEHLANHEALGYTLDADAVRVLTEAVGITKTDLAKKVAAKVRRYRREMAA